MAYPVKAVANAFIKIAHKDGAKISPLKLQKLVYIAHGWNLALRGEPLVADELPEAWQFGPVFPSLYHEFKDYGSGPIERPATDLEFFGPGTKMKFVQPEIPEEDEYTWALLRRVWDQYGKYGAMALSELTHKPGSPWDQVRKSTDGVRNADIGNDTIRHHYEQLKASRQKPVEAAAQ